MLHLNVRRFIWLCYTFVGMSFVCKSNPKHWSSTKLYQNELKTCKTNNSSLISLGILGKMEFARLPLSLHVQYVSGILNLEWCFLLLRGSQVIQIFKLNGRGLRSELNKNNKNTLLETGEINIKNYIMHNHCFQIESVVRVCSSLKTITKYFHTQIVKLSVNLSTNVLHCMNIIWAKWRNDEFYWQEKSVLKIPWCPGNSSSIDRNVFFTCPQVVILDTWHI